MSIYLDGVLEQELSIAHVGDIAGGAQLSIGRHNVSPQSPLIGTVDELEIFNRALTQAEIQSVFLAGSAGKCKLRVGDTVTLDGTRSVDPDGDPLTYRWTLLTTPAGSAATLSDPHAAQPTFVVDQPGTYRVQLIVNDGVADSTPAEIALVVLDANRPSIALDDAYTVTLGQTLTVPVPGVLANDNDPDGTPLSATLVSGPSHGTLNFAPTGSFTYTADPGVHGPGPTAHTVIATVYTTGVPRAVAVNAATNRVYVPSIFGNTVTVIDGTTNKTIAVVHIPHSYLEEVALNPLTNRIYASGTRLSNYVPGGDTPNANEITVIDGATNTILTTIPVADQPQALAVNPSTNRLYVAHVPLNTVSVIDGATNTVVTSVPVGTHPQQIGVDPVLNRIYVLSTDDDAVTVLDGATNTALATLAVGDEPRFLAVEPSTHRVYVANFTSDTVSVIDGETNAVVTTIPIGDGPQALAVNPITNRLYVGNVNSNSVSVVDTTTQTVRTTMPVDTHPQSLAVNVLTNRVYVSNLTSNTVSVIDGNAEIVTASVPVGAEPQVVGVNPVTDWVYVSEAGTHAVSILHVGDHFVYKASDGALDSNLATVTLIIEPSNLAPAALPDAYRVPAGTTLTVAAPGVLGNDLDATGSGLTALQISGPSHDTVTLQANGAFTYTPLAGFSGTATFSYKASNGVLESNTATVIIAVIQPNRAPHIISPPVTTATVGQPYSYDVDATDPDTGDTLTFSLLAAPAGMAINATTGLIQWIPTLIQVGSHNVVVQVQDTGGLVATQSFTINVVVSVNHPPVAVDDAYDTTQSGQILLDFTNGQLPSAQGWTYDSQCAPNFPQGVNLLESQAVSIAGGLLHLDTTGRGTTEVDAFYHRENLVDVNRTQVFEARLRVVNVEPASLPTTQAFNLFIVVDQHLHILQIGEGEIHTQDVTQGGVLTPFDTSAFHTYTLVRPAGSSPTYTILVDGIPILTGDARFTNDPVYVSLNQILFGDQTCQSRNGSVEVDFVRFQQFEPDGSFLVPAPGVLGNDSDPDGNPLAAALVTPPTHGVLTFNSDGAFTYVPDAHFLGLDTFTYKANDGTLESNIATVTITVGVTNHPPHITSPPVTMAEAGRAYTYDVQAIDPDGDALSFALTTAPPGMAIDASTGMLQWTPTFAQLGSHDVVVQVHDTAGLVDTQSFHLVVAAVNRPPVALDDAYDSTQSNQILLDFSDGQLPSAKGWPYGAGCSKAVPGGLDLLENQAFSVSGGLLHLDTTGRGTTAVAAYYQRDDIPIDPSRTQVFEARLRVLAVEPASLATTQAFSLSLNCGGCAGNLFYLFQVGDKEVLTFDPPQGGSSPVDTPFSIRTHWSGPPDQ
jgi:YVTN family beta-propeller protein